MTDRNYKTIGNIEFIPFRYQGQYHDIETGLYYNRFRYYDPTTGNYIQQDPIRLQGGNPTLYAYVADTNGWVDPFGLDRCNVFNVPEDYLNEALRQQGLNTAPDELKQPWTHNGFKYEVRIHEGDTRYTSAKTIYRVSRQQILPPGSPPGTQGTGTFYLGTDAQWYHTSVLKPNNPLYNRNAAQITHIPLP